MMSAEGNDEPLDAVIDSRQKAMMILMDESG
jgi:hypothetical protein